MKNISNALFVLLLLLILGAFKTTIDPKNIVKKAYYNQRSDAFTMSLSMKVVRPKWTRELQFKTWSLGSSYGLMHIQKPSKDKGINFLRIKSEGWNWLPSITRIIKISPSQMSQSWMGSDFTNEDLLKEASIVYDYTHELLEKQTFKGVACYHIKATPKPEAAVVWGKVLLWISKTDFLQYKAEYYDETGKLINTLIQKDFKLIDEKKIAGTLEMIPANKKGYKTQVKVLGANFKAKLTKGFFSISNLKRLGK